MFWANFDVIRWALGWSTLYFCWASWDNKKLRFILELKELSEDEIKKAEEVEIFFLGHEPATPWAAANKRNN